MKSNYSKVSTNFSKGLNMAASHIIDPQCASIAENFLFDEGSPYVREGTKVHASLPAPVVSMAKYYKKNGSSYFCAFAGNNLYASNLSGNFVSVSSGMVSGDTRFTLYHDTMMFTNFSTNPLYFNGSSVDYLGLSSPIFRKQIWEFEGDEDWSVIGGSSYFDTFYSRIDYGTRSLRLLTNKDYFMGNVIYVEPRILRFVTGGSGVLSSPSSSVMGLHRFASNVSSDNSDNIEIFICHEKLANISTIDIAFYDKTGTNQNSIRITDTSAYRSCSSDSFPISYTIPKTTFSGTMVWASAVGGLITMWGASGNSAVASFDNLRMTKCPPIPTAISSAAKAGTLFFGSSITTQPQNEFPVWGDFSNIPIIIPHSESPDEIIQPTNANALNPGSEQVKGQQLEGLTISSAPLPADGGIKYFYKATFLKESPFGTELESNPTYQSSGVVLSTNLSTWAYVALTNIPIAPSEWGVSARNIYRRRSDESYFRRVAQIADNASIDFIDTVPEFALGRTIEENHYPPPAAKFIYTAQNQRTYYYNINDNGTQYPSRVRWSMEYEPFYVPLENVRDISPNDGAEGTGIFEFFGKNYFLKERSMWLMDDDDSLKQVHSNIGCVAPNSIAVGDSDVFWMSEEGIIKYNYQFRNISREGARLNTLIDRLPKEYIKNAAGTFYKGKYLLAVCDSGYTYNNKIICYDLINDRFSIFPDINVNCWTSWHGYKDGYRLFYGNNSGQICEFFSGDYDISSHIPSRIKTKDFGLPTPTQGNRKAFFYTESIDGQARSFSFKPYLDFTNDTAHNDTIDSSGSNLTKFVFPQDDDASFLSLEIQSSGRYRVMQLDVYSKQEEIR